MTFLLGTRDVGCTRSDCTQVCFCLLAQLLEASCQKLCTFYLSKGESHIHTCSCNSPPPPPPRGLCDGALWPQSSLMQRAVTQGS